MLSYTDTDYRRSYSWGCLHQPAPPRSKLCSWTPISVPSYVQKDRERGEEDPKEVTEKRSSLTCSSDSAKEPKIEPTPRQDKCVQCVSTRREERGKKSRRNTSHHPNKTKKKRKEDMCEGLCIHLANLPLMS
ncbi:unnamed protein product [Allacma fusca]|uniref:Uncharacterized protein n=1 Tax=Allacma fusca TaxID=39272 RepID=A0A8J2LYP1_9HEXA|nr:unnamed protein product [Allacma fusca]